MPIREHPWQIKNFSTADIVDLGSSSSVLAEEVKREGVIVWND